MSHGRFEQWVVEDALGLLAGGDQARLREHLLGGCADCERLGREIRSLAQDLALSVEPVEPDPAIEGRLLAEIRARKRRPQPVIRLARRRDWLSGWRWALPALALLGLGGWFVQAGRLAAELPVVESAQGGVQVDGRPAGAGSRVGVGSVVSTDAGSEAFVRIGPRALFWMKQGSRVTVAQVDGAIRLRLERGWLLQEVRHGTAYSVETPLGTATAHGTVFFAMVESPKEAYFCICKDSLRLDCGGRRMEVASKHHAGVEVNALFGRLRMERVRPQFHNDADVARLEARF